MYLCHKTRKEIVRQKEEILGRKESKQNGMYMLRQWRGYWLEWPSAGHAAREHEEGQRVTGASENRMNRYWHVCKSMPRRNLVTFVLTWKLNMMVWVRNVPHNLGVRILGAQLGFKKLEKVCHWMQAGFEKLELHCLCGPLCFLPFLTSTDPNPSRTANASSLFSLSCFGHSALP